MKTTLPAPETIGHAPRGTEQEEIEPCQRGLILQCAAGETGRVWLQGDTIVVLTDLAPIALLP